VEIFLEIMQCSTDMYCLNMPFTGCICKACALRIIVENLNGNFEYTPFCLYTLSLERYSSVRSCSVHHPYAPHHHVPEDCVLVLVNIMWN